jgi:hypothetical protein
MPAMAAARPISAPTVMPTIEPIIPPLGLAGVGVWLVVGVTPREEGVLGKGGLLGRKGIMLCVVLGRLAGPK